MHTQDSALPYSWVSIVYSAVCISIVENTRAISDIDHDHARDHANHDRDNANHDRDNDGRDNYDDNNQDIRHANHG